MSAKKYHVSLTKAERDELLRLSKSQRHAGSPCRPAGRSHKARDQISEAANREEKVRK